MRLSKFAVPAATLALVAAGTAVAVADPGPFGPNNYGLCTAYFAGSEQGQAQKRKAPPFAALEATAAAANQTVAEWCEANGTHPGKGKGKNEG